MEECPCGSGKGYDECCRPVISGERPARTAEELMRARYTAYAKAQTDFLLTSLHPDQRATHDAEGVRAWAERSQWHGLDLSLIHI